MSTTIDLFHRLEGPSLSHFFGTDELGRDLFLRTLQGSGSTLLLALFSGLLCSILAVPLGAFLCTLPRRIENLGHRTLDALSILPPLLLAMIFSVVFTPSLGGMALILSLSAVVTMTRLTGILVRQHYSESYVEGLKALGASGLRILFSHVIPGASRPLISAFLSQIPHIVLAESFLSFLGLGLQAPNVSLGLLAAQGWTAISSAPHLFLFPSLTLTVILMAFHLPFHLSIQRGPNLELDRKSF